MNEFSSFARITYVDFVSVGNDELTTQFQYDPTFTNPSIKCMSLTVDRDCEVILNGHSTFKIKPNLGFNISKEEIEINTFQIVTAGVSVYAIIGY